MNAPACTAERPVAAGWLARLGRAMVAAHREAFVPRQANEARVLADLHAPQVPPTAEELRDAYRLWFGGDPTRKL
jgi:hypothetical protein